MLRKCLSMITVYPKRTVSSVKPRGIDWATQEKELILGVAPYDYTRKMLDKHHDMTISAINHWLRIPEDKVKAIQEISQIATSWAILIDDILDDSPFRYGVPSAPRVFGVGLAANAASYALLVGGEKALELGHPSAIGVYFKGCMDYIHGQAVDAYWRDNYVIPTEEEHMDMVRRKIGSCYGFTIELMQLFSNSEKDCIGLATTIGMFYEILDDYYSVFHPKGLENFPVVKPDNYNVTSDITESKITLAIIHAMQFPDVADELTFILKRRTSDPRLINRAVWLLKKHGSDQYMRDALSRLDRQIRQEIEQLGGNAKLTATMDDLRY